MPGPDRSVILHAGAVALAGRGVLILGAAGSGKSSLALRLMAFGAALVADDRTCVEVRPDGLWASAPAPLRGLIEARGVGLLRADPLDEVRLALAVDLDLAPAARMPQAQHRDLLDTSLPLLCGADHPHVDVVILQYLKAGPA